jgi:hypothetical protein
LRASPESCQRLCFPVKNCLGPFLESKTLESMSIDELWDLREQVVSTLVSKIAAEQAKLEERLRKIENASSVVKLDHRRP